MSRFNKPEEFYKVIASNNLGLVSEHFKDILELIGFDAFFKLIFYFGGSQIYLPTFKSMFKECIKKELVEEYNGSNMYSLSVKYGISERVIRNWVRELNNRGV